jgi:cyclophilin family peptidyl-prolyl cis-trans isomerase
MARKLLSGVLVGILLITAGVFTLSCKDMPHSPQLWERFLAAYPGGDINPEEMDSPPEMIIDTTKEYIAIIETEKGDLTLELFAEDAPMTVNSFVFLALAGFYDDLTFERVIMGFIAESSDPARKAGGAPRYVIQLEISERKHITGALSMIQWQESDLGSSQFFICYVDLPEFDGQYTVFGDLKLGWNTFLHLTPRDPMKNPDFPGVKIIRVIINEE